MKTTPRDYTFTLKQSKKHPQKTSAALNRELKEHGINVSTSIVRIYLLEAARWSYRPRKNQFMTQPINRKRYLGTLKYKNWTVKNLRKILFKDKSHFPRPQRQGWRSPGGNIRDCHINQHVKHPQKKMFWDFFV